MLIMDECVLKSLVLPSLVGSLLQTSLSRISLAIVARRAFLAPIEPDLACITDSAFDKVLVYLPRYRRDRILFCRPLNTHDPCPPHRDGDFIFPLLSLPATDGVSPDRRRLSRLRLHPYQKAVVNGQFLVICNSFHHGMLHHNSQKM
jgi:hypothetical protein